MNFIKTIALLTHSFLSTLKYKRSYQLFALALIAVAYLAFIALNDDRVWAEYRGNAETNSYSPLTQINKSNVQNLQVAWQFGPGNPASAPNTTAVTGAAPTGRGFGGFGSESNPIIVDGVMYSALARNKIYAVNATTGEQIWEYNPLAGGGFGSVTRGVNYWEKGSDKRILAAAGSYLIAIDAKTGEAIKTFGTDGKVDLREGLRDDPKTIQAGSSSPGVVYGDLIIMGSRVDENYGAAPGYIRAYNCVTGKLVWTFHTIPLPGEVGYKTWPKDAWKEFGGDNDWAGLSLDRKRGMVFIATGGTSYDFYGVDRPGDNLFADCVVALNAKTGKYIWHFQTIHHDLWDWDLTSPPNLVTITKNGVKRDAVVQLSKSGFVFVLDRVTGKSLFPIKEVPVPKSDIPGEITSPTQPVPVLPKPVARQIITEKDISNFSQAAHDSSLKLFRSLRYDGMFTPPSIRGTFHSPGSNGGPDWGGGSFDPRTNIIYIKSNDAPEIIKMQKIENRVVSNQTDFEVGKGIYSTYCVACHGADKLGDEQSYPSLINVQKRLTDEQIIAKIKAGGGKMPGFASVVNDKAKEAAILTYISGTDTKTRTASTSEAAAPGQKVRYTNVVAYRAIHDMDGNPFVTPPWGSLIAINLATGKDVFRVPAGNDAARQKPGEPETGLTGNAGAVATAGNLVFLGGSSDRKFRAFDSKTGKVVWETTLPGPQNALPSIYKGKNGKEYIAINIGADKDHPNGSIIAYSLKN
jgi:quinoprotein glucose dehydrogenase